MPSSRGEWSLFFVSCAAIASLIALNLVVWQNYSASEPVAGPEPRGTVETGVASGSGVNAEPNAVVSTPKRPARSAPTARRQETPAEPATSHLADLSVKAATGDCWLEIRVGSATGSVLFSGLLSEGQAVRFSRRALWIRAGAPHYLAVRVNGKPARDFPVTTADALITARGIEILGLG